MPATELIPETAGAAPRPRPSEPASGRTRPWAPLAAAILLLLVANGRICIPIAAWLGPLFLVRFLRTQRAARGLLIGFVALAGVAAFQYRGMIPVPGAWYYAITTVLAILAFLPYLADRLLVPRIAGFLGTLALPLAWTSVEFLQSRWGIYGSWGSVAYTQYGDLPLLQVLSITGMSGVAFLIAWLASLGNWIWQEGPASRQIRPGALTYAAVVLLVLLLGGARLALFPPASPTVRAASISRPDIPPPNPDALRRLTFRQAVTGAEIERVRGWNRVIADDLLGRADREAQAGAKIVFWGETNLIVFKEDETELIGRGRELARRRQIYLGMALGSWNRARWPAFENKIVMITPAGEVAWQYHKARPVPGPEAAMQVRGDARIPNLVTPFGRIGAVICFDLDFPGLLRQAGRSGTDLLIAPSNDWKAIDPWHTQMAVFRAIEQGFSLVRHTSQGLSVAVDYQGRVLAEMDHYQATDRAMVSQVPTRGVHTIYAQVGDLFAWLAVAGLIVMIVTAILRKGTAA